MHPELYKFGKAAVLSLMATRGEKGVTEEEAAQIEKWVGATLVNHRILQLVEEGKVFVDIDPAGELKFRSPEPGSIEEDYLKGIVW